MAQVLIDRGANVSKIDNEDKSVLMVQMKLHCVDILCKLIFQLATLRGNEPLVKLLLKSGADAQHKNKVVY